MAILMRLNIYREYLDLSRNQKLLKQLVTRRGIPVLDNIQLGLQKIKNILAGEEDPVNDMSQFVLGSRLM
jgi:raw